MFLTHQLHIIYAHLLSYSSLLEDFRKTVKFILLTPNPAMDSFSDEDRLFSRRVLERECHNLLLEIERLEMARRMQDKRLKNVMNLVCTSHQLPIRRDSLCGYRSSPVLTSVIADICKPWWRQPSETTVLVRTSSLCAPRNRHWTSLVLSSLSWYRHLL